MLSNKICRSKQVFHGENNNSDSVIWYIFWFSEKFFITRKAREARKLTYTTWMNSPIQFSRFIHIFSRIRNGVMLLFLKAPASKYFATLWNSFRHLWPTTIDFTFYFRVFEKKKIQQYIFSLSLKSIQAVKSPSPSFFGDTSGDKLHADKWSHKSFRTIEQMFYRQ